jgi:LysM repeat protein
MKINTPNPLIPQGALPEVRSKSRTRIVVFAILAVHVVFVCVLLLQGCKRTTETGQGEETNVPALPTFEPPTNLTPPQPSPFQPPVPSQPTQLVSDVIPQVPPPVPPPQPPPTVPGEGEREHVVVKGDSFYTLGRKYGVSSKAIAEANPGVDSTRLKLGQKLRIPAPSPTRAAHAGANGGTTETGEKIYSVKSGDTLLKIAKAHGVTVKALRSANKLPTDQIKVGQKLRIPAKASAPAGEAPPPGGGPGLQ